jgi:hypothetical protein
MNVQARQPGRARGAFPRCPKFHDLLATMGTVEMGKRERDHPAQLAL